MSQADPSASRVEHFRIARGAVGRMRSVVLVVLAGVIAVAAAAALLGATGALGGKIVFVFPGGLVALVAALMTYMNLGGRLDLGADGVLIDWRDSKRYVAFADLEDAPVYLEAVMGKELVGVALELRKGGPIKVPIGENQFGADRQAAELSRRIRAGLAVHRRREQGDDSSLLARGSRSPEAWLQRLRNLGEGANAGPREAPIPVERLWRIVENPAVDASARAGAAVALGGKLDEEGKQRLRVAAESTAAPQLRIAMESAVTGDEEAAVAALAAMKVE